VKSYSRRRFYSAALPSRSSPLQQVLRYGHLMVVDTHVSRVGIISLTEKHSKSGISLAMFPSFVPEKARPLASRHHLIPSIFAVCLAGTVLPPNLFNILSVTTSALYLSAQIPAATSGTIPQDYMLPIQALVFITQWADFCVIHSPDEFSRDKDKEKVPKTWLEKLRWSWSLNTTLRGIGWNWRVKNIPEAAPLSTTKW